MRPSTAHAWLTSALLVASIHLIAQTQPPAQNPSDGVRDLKRSHPPENGASSLGVVPESYALVIGITHYANLPASMQLRYPDRDAQSIYTTLISQQGGRFPANHVRVLTDAQATQSNILQEMGSWLPAVTTPNDRVLIYFAGHGFISGGKGYLAPYDVDLHNISGTAIPMDVLGTLIGSKIKGKWKVLLTDACHSGAITPETDPEQLNHMLGDQQSIFSLTASREREQSFESAEQGGGHGIFTYYVVQGLAGSADENDDGVVTADELAEYVHINVRNATHELQNPTSERASFDKNMVIAYDSHVPPGGEKKPKYGTLVFVTNMDNTELWLDGKNEGVLSTSSVLRKQGLTPGSHTIKAVHKGYKPDGPREEMVYPGEETTVKVRLLIPQQPPKASQDLLDRAIDDYKKGSEANYKKAESKLNEAITIYPNYSEAWMYLGRVESALWADEKASAAFQRAIAIDLDYEEARVGYAATLLDEGALDEAVRQLNAALQQKPADGTALYLLSQAYAREDDFADCKAAALRAVKVVPGNGEAHFWLAWCERHLNEPAAAEAEYRQYLQLTNFNSGAMEKALCLLGMGCGHHASQQDIWREQRGQANLGICDCEWMQKRYDAAIPYCQKALTFMPGDSLGNYRLGLIYVEKANAAPSSQDAVNLLNEAKIRFSNVVATNPDTREANRAQQYIARIDNALASHP